MESWSPFPGLPSLVGAGPRATQNAAVAQTQLSEPGSPGASRCWWGPRDAGCVLCSLWALQSFDTNMSRVWKLTAGFSDTHNHREKWIVTFFFFKGFLSVFNSKSRWCDFWGHMGKDTVTQVYYASGSYSVSVVPLEEMPRIIIQNLAFNLVIKVEIRQL